VAPSWRLLERLGTGGWGLVALALLVGAGAGLRYMIKGFTWVSTSRHDLGASSGESVAPAGLTYRATASRASSLTLRPSCFARR
jgi:hypothetical protein